MLLFNIVKRKVNRQTNSLKSDFKLIQINNQYNEQKTKVTHSSYQIQTIKVLKTLMDKICGLEGPNIGQKGLIKLTTFIKIT